MMDCTSTGTVIWMDDRAKQRLGEPRDLWSSTPQEIWGELAGLLNPTTVRDRDLVECLFRAGEREGWLPVRLIRRLRWAGRVVLQVEPRGRVSDSDRVVERIGLLLSEIQSLMVRNYFRLLTAQSVVERCGRRFRLDAGKLVTRELERERSRLARELHSSAGQALAGIRLNLELIQSVLPNPPEAIRPCLERILFLSEEVSDELRSVANRLHPPDWQCFTLKQAIERLWVASGIPGRFKATIRVSGLESEPPNAIRIAIYRACQEALANVMRHSRATEVSVSLEKDADRISLIVDDNGRGIAESSQQRIGGLLGEGIGLRAMMEHAELLGGRCQVRSGPHGTHFEFSLPLLEES